MAKLLLTIEIVDKNINISSDTDFDTNKAEFTEQEELVIGMTDFLYRGIQAALQNKLGEETEEN